MSDTKMSYDEAIKMIENENACVNRADICDRNCYYCDLVKKKDDIVEAQNMAIKALKFQKEWQPKIDNLTLTQRQYIWTLESKIIDFENKEKENQYQKTKDFNDTVDACQQGSNTKVQKCIERLEENFKYKCEWKNECLKEMETIIKEEMGVEE